MITKYDPQNRDAEGRYLKDEWTEYGDIGRKFGGKEFTYQEYAKIEEKHIQAVLLFMECLGIDSLKVIKLEFKGKKPDKVTVEGRDIYNNIFYSKETIVFIIQSVLRYKFWCALEAEGMRVRFEYDYYMNLACFLPCADTIKKIEEMGLFVEKSTLEFLFDEDEMQHVPAAILQ